MKLKTTILFAIIFLAGQISFSQPVLTLNSGRSGQSKVAFSPDSKYFIEGSTLSIVETGQVIRTFPTDFSIQCVAYSPDGKTIANAGYGEAIVLWDPLTGNQKASLKGHLGHVMSVAFSPDSKKIISGSFDKTIKLWDTQTGLLLNTFTGHKDLVLSVAFSPSGTQIVSGSADKTVQIWDITKGKEKRRILEGHTNMVNSVAFSSNGKYVASGSLDNTVKIWDAVTGSEIRTIKGEGGIMGFSVTFSPDSKHILVYGYGYKDGSIKTYDIVSGIEIKSLSGHKYEVASAAISPDGKKIISSDAESTKLWDVELGHEIKTFSSPLADNFSFSFNEKFLVSSYHDISIIFWSTLNNQNNKFYKGFNNFDLSPDNKHIVVDNPELNRIEYIDFTNNQLVSSYNLNTVTDILINPTRKEFAAKTDFGNIHLFQIPTINETKNIKTDTIMCLAYSNNGKYIVSGHYNGSIIFWDTETGNKHKILRGPTNGDYGLPAAVHDIAFGKDDKTIISGTWNKTTIWGIDTGQEMKTFTGNCSAISPDGKLIATYCNDYTIKLWDIETGIEKRTMKGHTGNFLSHILFSKDGKFIIYGNGIWKTETGELLINLYKIKESEDWLAITPDGRFDGTKEGLTLLYYVDGMQIIPLESMYEQFYTPNLFARIMAGEEFENPEVKIENLKLPPLVEITSPKDQTKLSSNQLTVNVKVIDQGGGIDEIRLYLNGKLIETTQRGFIKVEQNGNEKTKFTLTLTNGENKIKATAFNTQRTEAIPDEITVFYNGAQKTANLHMLVIGIDNYMNSKYKLNYAVADAIGFKDEVEKGSQDIFGSVNITFLKDADANKEGILQEFEKLKTNVQQEDVFIFYYAGHGVMSEEEKSQFYIVPYDVTQLYGNNDMLKNKAISAEELQNFSIELKAQKQMFVFDACQSGGMTEMLASRGAAEEKAIAQLARSTGTYWLAASNSEQFATEFAELGHGIFTYSIILGLQGQADGGTHDKKITVKELSAFLNDNVPELSEKYKGTPQWPTSYGYGQDFPIIIVK